MEKITLQLDDNQEGRFVLLENAQELGEMVISINGSALTVYHTEVKPEAEGKGLAKKLLENMVDHARQHHLKVIPLCPYVHAQFKRHPEAYQDVWQEPI